MFCQHVVHFQEEILEIPEILRVHKQGESDYSLDFQRIWGFLLILEIPQVKRPLS